MVAPIDQLDRIALEALCRQRHVRRLALFGSYSRGEAGPDSDIDILVDYEPNQSVTYLDLVDLADGLSELFGQGRRVDLVTRPALHPLMRKHVEQDMVVLYER